MFSVKSLYRFLQDSGVVDNRYVRLWNIKSPLKVRIFIWLVLKRRVMTRDILLKRGWTGFGLCCLCLEAEETADHLFVGCEFAKSILERLLCNKRAVRRCENVVELWEWCRDKQGTVGRRELTTIAATWWNLWLERNGRIFQDSKRSPGALIAIIRSSRVDWASFCP